jgi:hypothetical protein
MCTLLTRQFSTLPQTNRMQPRSACQMAAVVGGASFLAGLRRSGGAVLGALYEGHGLFDRVFERQ